MKCYYVCNNYITGLLRAFLNSIHSIELDVSYISDGTESIGDFRYTFTNIRSLPSSKLITITSSISWYYNTPSFS